MRVEKQRECVIKAVCVVLLFLTAIARESEARESLSSEQIELVNNESADLLQENAVVDQTLKIIELQEEDVLEKDDSEALMQDTPAVEQPEADQGDTILEASQESTPEDAAVSMLDVLKEEIGTRSKLTGTLDLYDAQANRVRTLKLIELQEDVKKEGEEEIIVGKFRDTQSADTVLLDIKVETLDGQYKLGDMAIAEIQAPESQKDARKDYTDQEIGEFMKEYIAVQSQGTGTFDLYDEKIKKLRNLQFVALDDNIRRYGIIAISTATFNDVNSNEIVKIDVNCANKDGLAINAMRIKKITRNE